MKVTYVTAPKACLLIAGTIFLACVLFADYNLMFKHLTRCEFGSTDYEIDEENDLFIWYFTPAPYEYFEGVE